MILGRKSTSKGYELVAGAKVFSYLRGGRPIIGVLPRDETRKILHRVGVSTIADVESIAEIITVFRQILDAWSTGTLSSLVPDRVACAAYSVEPQTAALVRALEGAPAIEPFVPGVVEIPPSLRGEISTRDMDKAREDVLAARPITFVALAALSFRPELMSC